MSDTGPKQERTDENGVWEVDGAFDQLMAPTEEFLESIPPEPEQLPSEVEILRARNATLEYAILDINNLLIDILSFLIPD
jgi:hypothetical protein